MAVIVTSDLPVGAALVESFVSAGHEVSALSPEELPGSELKRDFDVVFAALSWTSLQNDVRLLAEAFAGLVLVVCTTASHRDAYGHVVEPVPHGSVSLLAAHLFPSSRVVGAFQQLTADHLRLADIGALVTDVLVVGDDREATDLVEGLVDELRGCSSVYFGGLRSSRAAEGFAAIIQQVSEDQGLPVGFRVWLDQGTPRLRFLTSS